MPSLKIGAKRRVMSLLGLLAVAFSGTAALAQQPTDWQISLSPSASPVMDQIIWLNNFTLIIITAITLFVLALLAYCVVRYNARANPVASKTSHNTMIEVVWTVVPIIILLAIVAPSIRLLYVQTDLPDPDVTVKVTGYQWLWSYEYPDHEIDEYFSTIIRDADPAIDEELRRAHALNRGGTIEDYPRLLAVDNELVVPVGKVVQLDITSADVIHAVAFPSFGVKMDAIPGRLNSTWFRAEREGLYYGQCSQICGVDHAFMPLAVRVVDQETFDNWVAAASEDLDAGWELLAADIEHDRLNAAQYAQNEAQ